MSNTMWAILLAPLLTGLLWLPIRGLTRLAWRKLPDGKLKKILFGKVRWMDYPPGARPWDQ